MSLNSDSDKTGCYVKNYFKIAWRIRNKVYSFINICGPSHFILLWVQDEMCYDRYHDNADLLYRSIVHWRIDNQEAAYATTPAPFAGWLKENIPEVDQACRFDLAGKTLFAFEDKLFVEPQGAYVENVTGFRKKTGMGKRQPLSLYSRVCIPAILYIAWKFRKHPGRAEQTTNTCNEQKSIR